jgi:hypothetical protein
MRGGGLNPRILLIGGAVVLAFLLLSLTRGRHASSATKENAGYTKAVFTRIDQAQTKFRARHGRYTGSLADLIQIDPKLAPGTPVLDIKLDSSIDGKTYAVRLTSDTMYLTRTRTNGKQIDAVCKLLKSGLKCPPGTKKAD